MDFILISEIGAIMLFLFCYIHGFRQKKLMLLGSALAFGFILEEVTFQLSHAYSYGRFYLVVWDIPVAILLGWAIIIYSSMQLTDLLKLPLKLKPVADGLLALNIDLVMDPIASAAGFWHWNVPVQFLGVPYGNFVAWFSGAMLFSLCYRVLEQKKGGAWLAAVYAAFATIALNAMWLLVPGIISGPLFWLIVLMAVAFVLFRIDFFHKKRADLLLIAVPAAFLSYFPAIIAYPKVIVERDIIVFCITMAVIGLFVRSLPFFLVRKRRS